MGISYTFSNRIKSISTLIGNCVQQLIVDGISDYFKLFIVRAVSAIYFDWLPAVTLTQPPFPAIVHTLHFAKNSTQFTK